MLIRSTKCCGSRFHNLIADGKNEYKYEFILADGMWKRYGCPLVSEWSSVSRIDGMSTSPFAILYNIINLIIPS